MTSKLNEIIVESRTVHGRRTTDGGDGFCGWDFHKLGTTTSGIIIFLSAGINLAQGFGWTNIDEDHFRYSWFIGVTLGTCLSLILRHFLPEKYIMALSSLTILIEGIVYLTVINNKALFAARYLNGIAVGMATHTFLIHTSEISLKAQRGVQLGIEHYAITVGICVQIVYSSKWNTYPAARLHGILDLILGIFAFAATWIYIESPIRFLRKGNDAAAMECLNQLHRAQGWKLTTDIIFEDLKDYTQEQLSLSWLEGVTEGLSPLIKMLFFRSMMLAFSFSLPLCTVLQYSTTIVWPQIVAACLRIFGCYLSYRLVDNFGRKIPSLIATAAMGSFILSIAIICHSDDHVFNTYKKFILAVLCLLTQFFAGFFAPFTSVYIGEAFALKVKPFFMAICIMVEQLIHVIVICLYEGVADDSVFMVQGILILIAFPIFCITMPETKKMALRGAQELFRIVIHLKMNAWY